MKKFFIQISVCLLILLCIPFSTFATIYNDDISSLISDIQYSKLQEIYNNSSYYDDFCIYISSSGNIFYSFELTNVNTSSYTVTLNNYIKITYSGDVSFTDQSTTQTFSSNQNKLIYLKSNGSVIFKNDNLTKTNISDNYLLFQVTNTVTNTVNGCTQSPNNQFFYGDVTVYYDSIIDISGYNFDVYYLVDNSYRLIQENINSFQILESHSVYKKQSSGNTTSCIYPTAPNIPKDITKTYKSSFYYNGFYFVINDELDLNTIIVKAPDTDSLLNDGNSNSQSVTSNNNQSNQLLNNTVNQMESLENGFKNDLTSNLDNINANDFNISGITQLSNAANFVRVQFDNLTKNNPFGIILGFSLFIGLSLLIIGKRL